MGVNVISAISFREHSISFFQAEILAVLNCVQYLNDKKAMGREIANFSNSQVALKASEVHYGRSEIDNRMLASNWAPCKLQYRKAKLPVRA